LTARARAKVDPQWERYLALVDRMFWSEQGCFSEGHETPEQLIEQFHRHNEAVKAGVPAERLLVWSVTEGWEPLCEFLGVAVPSEPLPHVNDRETFLGRVIDGALGKLGEWRAAETGALSSTSA
ncbi:MAG TPA: sulfotransferase, partial [Solirubrobacteraceae bacterium]|nr:sulfotransferase [Solirubrobacteraceae bacterium]